MRKVGDWHLRKTTLGSKSLQKQRVFILRYHAFFTGFYAANDLGRNSVKEIKLFGERNDYGCALKLKQSPSYIPNETTRSSLQDLAFVQCFLEAEKSEQYS